MTISLPSNENRTTTSGRSDHDTGQTGPDKSKGGKYLILGPDHPDMNPEGYFVFRSPTNNIWSGQRGLDADPAKAKAALEGMKIYRYRDNPPSDKTRAPNKPWLAAQPRVLKYWEGVVKTINAEPTIERDRIILAMLVPLGIEKIRICRPSPCVNENAFGG